MSLIRIALPNKGSLSERASTILTEAGYAGRRDSKALSTRDEAGGVEFFFLRPKDIAIYVAGGQLDLGITGRDLALDSGADVEEVMALGFGGSTFRYAAPRGAGIAAEDLGGLRIATSYPRLVRRDLERRGIEATVIRLDGAVEVSIKLGVADVIADVVSTGATLRKQGLEPFGEPIVTSEAVLVKRKGAELSEAHNVVLGRITGILNAHNYVMLDYNIDSARLDEATRLSPGLSSPTVAPLAREGWVAVRAMIPRAQANEVMDRLGAVGAEAILASDLRIARI